MESEPLRRFKGDYFRLSFPTGPPANLRRRGDHGSAVLHYADMSGAQRTSVGRILSSQPISVFVSYYWHDGKATEHERRFEIYSNLVKTALMMASSVHAELRVSIAQQGGWQGYQADFLRGLKALNAGESRSSVYRKVQVELQSGRHPGIQLADFYAGICRDFVLNPDGRNFPDAFRLIEAQTILEPVYFSREKGEEPL